MKERKKKKKVNGETWEKRENDFYCPYHTPTNFYYPLGITSRSKRGEIMDLICTRIQ
jgi:hypothetical protein